MLKYFLLAGYLLCVACSPLGASGPSLEERVEEQDRELRQMRPRQTDTWNEVQAMRQEIDSLKSQLRELNRANGALPPDLPRQDAALGQAGSTPTPALGSPVIQAPAYAAQSAQTAPETPPIRVVTPDSSAYMRNAAQSDTSLPPPTPASSLPAQGGYGLPPDAPVTVRPVPVDTVQAPSESTWGQADPKPVVQVPKKDISLALFDAGLNDFNARRYVEAERSFKDFIKNYPGHSQMAEAQYYLGECEFQRNNFPAAALEYDAVITKYPKSSLAPAAYLKQGIAFSKMNNPSAAKQRLQQLISKFPNSPEAARAKTFLKTNK